jgi:hypothetical protein
VQTTRHSLSTLTHDRCDHCKLHLGNAPLCSRVFRFSFLVSGIFTRTDPTEAVFNLHPDCYLCPGCGKRNVGELVRSGGLVVCRECSTSSRSQMRGGRITATSNFSLQSLYDTLSAAMKAAGIARNSGMSIDRFVFVCEPDV